MRENGLTTIGSDWVYVDCLFGACEDRLYGGKNRRGAKPSVQGIIIDTKTLAELEAEKMRLEQEVRASQQAQEGGDWRDVRNQYSTENALDERARDDRGSMTSSLKESAEAVGERMQANRDAYEQGLAEERAIRGVWGAAARTIGHRTVGPGGGSPSPFSLTDPVRTPPLSGGAGLSSAREAAKWSSVLRSILRERSLLQRSASDRRRRLYAGGCAGSCT